MAVDLGMGVDTRVTPGIHPQVVGSLEEFDEDTRPALHQVVDAFTSVYEGMGRVADAKAAADANTAWTNDQRTIKIQDAADRAFQKFEPQFDKAYHNMRNSIAALEKELTAPIEAQGAHILLSGMESRRRMRRLVCRYFGRWNAKKRPEGRCVTYCYV